jgi:hypothetical protein
MGVGVDAAAFDRLIRVLSGGQRRQGVGQVVFLPLFLGHPAPRSQSLQFRRLIGLSAASVVAGAILRVRPGAAEL